MASLCVYYLHVVYFQSTAVRTESESESIGGGDSVSQHSSPLSTPSLTKRKSIHDRKLRPKSVVDIDNRAPGWLMENKYQDDNLILSYRNCGDHHHTSVQTKNLLH